MFGRPANPYDDIINKATDEKQTEINWETALSVWDKVNEDGETGARNSVNALAKRLTHRSANVQLFSLTLAGALVNNCGPSLHREISGKAFTQALTRLINDRTTHDSVKKEALKSIEEWVKEHPNNADFDLLNDTYESLKRQNHKFPSSIARNPSPPRVDDEALRREEEDLQRALAESAALSNPLRGYQPSSSSNSQMQPQQSGESTKSLPSEPSSQSKPSRVRALYDFVGQSVEELEFRRGDVIRVVECLYEDWWKGENLSQRGRVGIFPRNHVEPLPEEDETRGHNGPPSQSTSQAPASEEDLEAEVFAQVALVDRLLALMSQLREQGRDFADNDELTDLYNSSMRLRPRVVKLIRKYDQKQADLEDMNRKVDQARGIYEGMLGHHRPQQQPPQHAPHAYGQPQTNGYHAHALPSQTHAEPYRAFSPAASSAQPHSASYPGQQTQQHVAPQPQAGVDPAIEEQQRRENEQKWAEYERQMEEYNRQLAAHQQYYQPQVAPADAAPISTDPHAQRQPAVPFTGHAQPSDPPYHSHDPQSHCPNSATSPVPSLSRSQSSTSTSHQPPGSVVTQAQPPQPQPEWNGQAWVWPTQIAVAAHPLHHAAHSQQQQQQPLAGVGVAAATITPEPPIPSHSPALSYSQQSSYSHSHQQQQQQPQHQPLVPGTGTAAAVGSSSSSNVTSPPPNVALYSSPPTAMTTTMTGYQPEGPHHHHPYGGGGGGGGGGNVNGLNEGVAGIRLNNGIESGVGAGAVGGYYQHGSGGGEDPAQAQWAT